MKEIEEKIKELVETDIPITFYFVEKKDSSNKLLFANMNDGLLKKSSDSIKKELNILITEERSLMNYFELDDRKDIIAFFPKGLKRFGKIRKIIDQINKQNNLYEDREFKNIQFFISYIQKDDNYIVTFKIIYPIQTIKKSTAFLYKKEKLVEMEDSLLRISYDFDFFICNKELYVVNVDKFDKLFNITDLVKAEAKILLKVVDGYDYFDSNSFNKFEEVITNDVKIGKKFVRSKSNLEESFKNISFDQISGFLDKNQAYEGLINIDTQNKQFIIENKTDVINMIKLFNEDRWESTLTKNIYDAVAKNRVKAN